MYLLYFIFGISITLNIITFIGLIIVYKKFFKDNPLSMFYNMPKKEKKGKSKAEDIIAKLKLDDMENWDL